MSGLVLRRGGPEDGPGIRKLLSEVFPDNPKCDPEIMEWQYWKNPFGPALTWVAEDAGRIVVHYSAIKVPMIVGGSHELGDVGVDAATAPSHRGRGLFVELMKRVPREMREEKICVTISFMGERSIVPRGAWSAPGQLAAGSLRHYLIPLEDEWLAKRLKIPRSASGILRKIVFRMPQQGARHQEVIPEGIDDLWARLEASVANGTVHDSRWWRWRYAEHPHSPYRFFELREGDALKAAAVTTRRHAFGGVFECVLELLAPNVATARALIGTIARESKGSAGVAMLALEGSPAAKLARATGMWKVPRRMEPNPLHLQLSDSCSEGERLSSRWSISWGDLDHL